MTFSLGSVDLRRVAELAAQGFSHRWIAHRLNVNRAAVPEILRRLRQETDTVAEKCDDPPGFDLANLRRCPGCGGIVYLWPCLACSLTTETADHTTSA